MNNHIPDAGKMVCPKCGAEPERTGWGRRACRFACDSILWDDGALTESFQCVTYQRDQLRARVEELEGWCQRMANILEEGGWESRAQNEFRKYMETKPKPEELR
jgi:hypothetical protein